MNIKDSDHEKSVVQDTKPIGFSAGFTAFFLCLSLLIVAFAGGLRQMTSAWASPEYSHAYMIPIVACFLIYRRLSDLSELFFSPSLSNAVAFSTTMGIAGIIVALFFLSLGELSSIFTLIQYGFILAVFSLSLMYLGIRALRIIGIPLLYLIFMIPLPNFIYANLSSQLQLISSSIGVYIIRLFDISVFLEGNVIDLGNYQLQVVDACSGLRYLFPLMSFGFLIAHLFIAPKWQKFVIFFSTIPITVFMNSFRIAVIGFTVDHWGISAAEGFLHDFEGWVVFMACLGLLIGEMYIFYFFSRHTHTFLESIDLSIPSVSFSNIRLLKLPITRATIIASLFTCISAIVISFSLNERQDIIPERIAFNSLPLSKGDWIGHEGSLQQNIINTLKLTDYMIADYDNVNGGAPINFYVAYYASQRKGASVHSPRSCIPGGGWRISNLSTVYLPDSFNANGDALMVNRAIIRKDNAHNLVYYWFQQRGRNITNEYLAKWYIFWDAITRNRTDGALIRVITPIEDYSDIENSDKHLQDFIAQFNPLLSNYIPQ